MKHALSIVMVLAALAQSAFAVRFAVWADGSYHAVGPASIVLDGRIVVNPTMEQCEAAGAARWETDAEVAAREAIEAAQAAANVSNAAAAESLPETFARGIAVLDDNGHWQRIVAITNGAPAITIQVSGSPLTAEQHAAMMESNAAVVAARYQAGKSAKSGGNVQAQLKAIWAILGVE